MELPVKLLFVNGHLKVGGVEKSLVDLLKSIDYTRHEVDLLLFEGLGDYAAQIPPQVHVILCDLRPTYGPFKQSMWNALKKRDFRSAYLRLVFMLSARFSVNWTSLMRALGITPKEYDCAIAYRVGVCADYVAFAAKAKKKCMWWHHGEFNYSGHTVNKWCQTLTRIDEVVSVSETTKRMILPHFVSHAQRMHVIPNMVIPQEIMSKANEFHPYASGDSVVLVSVGRLSEEKHMMDAVYAMEKLVHKGYRNLKWYLVGDGAQRAEIESEIVRRHLQEHVVCVGSQPNPYPYMADADVFVHLSHVESQGITVMEAFALDKKCVVVKSAGTQEYVVDGYNAWMAEQDVDSVVARIEELLQGENVIENMEENQRQTLASFSPESIIGKFERLIHE